MGYAETPAGFRQAGNGSGLLVPNAFARQREVWTNQEKKILDRTAKVLKQHRVKLVLACEHEGCRGTILAHREGDDMVLRCDCRDRHFVRGL